ncbi:hypothetical protein WKW79_33920 [Variovorax robiniae]|uniref:Transcriptional regulator n=1 Tax=Variovorax robiniae TaxID=1836199 RepID=A0ABU8XIB8_9BURK
MKSKKKHRSPDLPEATEKERLRQRLPLTARRLKEGQADRIDTGDIDAYVQLDWLEWHGGGLRLTDTGRNVCAHEALNLPQHDE